MYGPDSSFSVARLSRFTFAIALLGLIGPIQAKTLYVSKSGSDTDGSSWETAYRTIGGATSVATAGDEIWVASGLYVEPVSLPRGVSIFGGYTGSETSVKSKSRDPKTNRTVISGDRGLTYGPGISAKGNVIIDGFEVIEGVGSGIEIYDATFEVRNCIIKWSRAIYGGGVNILESTGVVDRSMIFYNYAEGGAGLSIEFSSVEIRNSLVFGNQAYTGFNHYDWIYYGGGGGGIFIFLSSLRIVNSVLQQNYVGSHGTGNNIFDPFYVPGIGCNTLIVNSIVDNASPVVDIPLNRDGYVRPEDLLLFQEQWHSGEADPSK